MIKRTSALSALPRFVKILTVASKHVVATSLHHNYSLQESGLFNLLCGQPWVYHGFEALQSSQSLETLSSRIDCFQDWAAIHSLHLHACHSQCNRRHLLNELKDHRTCVLK